MISALSAAKYLVYLSYGEYKRSLTHLKLQKLLYLAQGWSYVWDDKQLFQEDFMAWKYGPVCNEVYQHFRQYGSAEIPEYEGINMLDDEDAKATLIAVWDNFGGYTAYELVDMVHQQSIWKDAYSVRGIISKRDIQEFYQSTFS